MQTYFSTFLTGFEEVIPAVLKLKIRDVHIESVSDGLVVYKTNGQRDALEQVRFFNNSFVFLKSFPISGPEPIREMVQEALEDEQIVTTLRQVFPHKSVRFRIMATDENQLVAIDKKFKTKFEEIITRQLRNFILDRSFPDVELIFMIRRNEPGLLGLRFTYHTSYEKTLIKGEIYPELAHILCLISEPDAQDIFLDPFCGSGAIPIARAVGFPYRIVYASDTDDAVLAVTRSKVTNANKAIAVKKWDALHLSAITERSIDKIVTDPPWGLYSGKELNLEEFYTNMLTEFGRILKPEGILVILVAKKELFEEILAKFPGTFTLIKKYTTLVSGQKAGVYKIRVI